MPGYIGICGKSIRCRRVVKKNGLLGAYDGAQHRFRKPGCAVDVLAQKHGYTISHRHRFGLYAQFLASRNNQQPSLGARVLDGCAQDLLDQSFKDHLARDFFGEFPRPREIELFGSGYRDGAGGSSDRVLLPEGQVAYIERALLRR